MSRKSYGKPSKSVAHAIITIYTGSIEEDSADFDIVGEYFVTEKRLAQAIDNSVEVLDVFVDKIPDDNKYYKMPNGEKEISNLFMRQEDVPTKRTWKRQVATCAYNATNNYLQHWLGRKFDNHDRDWYAQHHLVTTDGLPQEFTFTVLQQLVQPYGCGIKSIQVPRNTRRFDEHKEFIEALGANPMFKVNGHTTNEEAYETLFPDIAMGAILARDGKEDTPQNRAQHKTDTFAGWRFECVDMPDLGAVAMKQFSLQSTGHNGGSNYYGPRGSFKVGDNDKWLMAIKFDELRNIAYHKQIALPEYKIYDGTIVYDWWAIKCDGEKTLRGYAPKYAYQRNTTTYNPETAGSGSTKVPYFLDALKILGYTEVQVTRMSWKTARELKDGKIKAEGISVLANGSWAIVENKNDPSEGQQTLLLEDKRSSPHRNKNDDEDKCLAYPPLCEECQKAPGDHVFDANGNLLCQACGAEVTTSIVPVSYLLEGWTAVSELASDFNEDDSELYELLFGDFEEPRSL